MVGGKNVAFSPEEVTHRGEGSKKEEIEDACCLEQSATMQHHQTTTVKKCYDNTNTVLLVKSALTPYTLSIPSGDGNIQTH